MLSFYLGIFRALKAEQNCSHFSGLEFLRNENSFQYMIKKKKAAAFVGTSALVIPV